MKIFLTVECQDMWQEGTIRSNGATNLIVFNFIKGHHCSLNRGRRRLMMGFHIVSRYRSTKYLLI